MGGGAAGGVVTGWSYCALSIVLNGYQLCGQPLRTLQRESISDAPRLSRELPHQNEQDQTRPYTALT